MTSLKGVTNFTTNYVKVIPTTKAKTHSYCKAVNNNTIEVNTFERTR